MLLTLEGLRQHHKHSGTGDRLSALMAATQSSLRYRRTLFNSTQLRLQSMEKRAQNLIQLVSFLLFLGLYPFQFLLPS